MNSLSHLFAAAGLSLSDSLTSPSSDTEQAFKIKSCSSEQDIKVTFYSMGSVTASSHHGRAAASLAEICGCSPCLARSLFSEIVTATVYYSLKLALAFLGV